MGAQALEAARAAYRSRDWVTARDCFDEARAATALSAEDLAALADAHWWLGDSDASLPVNQQAFRLYLDAGEPRPAALLALEIGYTYAMRGEDAQASGWMSRAARLLADEPECAEHGYLVYIDFETALGASELDEAFAIARRVHELGRRFADPNLTALGTMGQGRILLRQGRVDEGMPLLDEAMVAAVSDDLNPSWAGNVYCHLMVACYEIADLRRAGQWTEATTEWCETMPGAGPFMGICRLHRSQLLHIQGAWDQAEREAASVCSQLGSFDRIVAAEAHYQLGELRRLRGDLPGAEAAFRDAHAMGRDPQPGLALMRLAQGRARDAVAAITAARAAAPDDDPLLRLRLLPAAVEIALAAGDLEGASAAEAELAEITAVFGAPGLQAAACQARGLVLLAQDSARTALAPLQEALRLFRELDAPYDVARTRLLLAHSHELLGERDLAALERDAAQTELTRLGAALAVAEVRLPASARADGLTRREAEVLGMVAGGMSNQQVADALVLSVRTVERHLSTIYGKLGLQGRSARTAAVRYAVDQRIVSRT